MTTSVNGVQQPAYIRRENPYGYASSADIEQALSGASAFQGYATTPVPAATQDEFVSTTQVQPQEQAQDSNGCTDGEDDGHISFWSKIGNAIKGVGKSIVKGVKGMFTNSEGKFSLGKTLLSVGVIAASIAFPAVGLGLCAVGAVAGGVQVVKGGIKASKATTDAEAKEAWQNIGAGTFQVAASVAGAKASLGAMKSTSTATNGLASLSEDATMGQKASALLADAKSSTVNRFNTLTTQAKTLATRAEITNTFNKQNPELQANELLDAKTRLESLEAAGDTSSIEYQNALREVEIRETYIEHPVKAELSTIKGDVRATVSNAMDKIKNVNFKEQFNVSALPAKAQQAYQVLTTEGYSQAVTKCGYETVAQLINTIAAVDLTTAN